MTCECPYCMTEITAESVQYLIKKPDVEPESAQMRNFMTPTDPSSGNNKFARWWRRYNRQISPDILKRRIIRSRSDMEQWRADFANEAEKISQRTDSGKNLSESGRSGKIQPGSKAGGKLGDSGKSNIICEIKVELSADQLPPQYVIYENGSRIAMTRLVCPECNNVIPDEIFTLPLIRIGLASGQGGGKTCMALSLLRSLYDMPLGGGLNGHSDQMDFISMVEEDSGMEADDEFSKMLTEFKEGICPPHTKERYVPPIFLKMNWKRGQHRAIVGLYDASGEVITGSRRDSEMIFYMSHMYGIIYMIEPAKTGLQGNQTNRLLFSEEDRNCFYEKSVEQDGSGGETARMEHVHMLPPDKQMEIQSDNFWRGETLETIMVQRLSGQTAVRHNGSLEVLEALRAYVKDDILRNRIRAALAISRCDELRDNAAVADYDKGNLLFRDERELTVDQNRMREQIMKKLFSEKIFNLPLLEGVFKSCSYHMVAALGCPAEIIRDDGTSENMNGENGERYLSGSDKERLTRKSRMKGNYAPIRVEEPLLKLISLYAEDHGWNE